MYKPSEPDAIIKAIYNHAKNQWAWALTIKAISGSIGIISALAKIAPTESVIAVFLLLVLSEWLQLNSDRVKSVAETLKRKRDMQDSFGWEITPEEWTKVLAEYQSALKNIKLADASNMYFASKLAVSPARAVDNLHESTFFSSMVFNKMGRICWFIMGGFTLLAIASFATVAHVVTKMDVHTAIDAIGLASRVIVGVLLILLGLGITKMAIGYNGFAQKAEKMYTDTGKLRQSNAVDEIQAIKLWHEYQIARASSPLVPEWLFGLWAGELNRIYQSNFATNN